MSPSTLRKTCILLLVAIVAAYTVPAVFAFAGEAEAPAASGGEGGGAAPAGDAPAAGKGFLEQMWSGGPIGWADTLAIIATSVVTVALAIEFWFSIRREVLAPPELVATLDSLFQEQNLEEAMTICQSNDSYLAKCMEGALSKVNEGEEKMRDAIADAAGEKVLALRVKVGYINLMAVLAPMLGLYGTVLGMIMCFAKIAQEGTPKPAQLADGIQLALWSTAEGLTVAIPASALYYYYKNKLDSCLVEVGRIIEDLTISLLGGGSAEEEEGAAEG